jgi:hypothetical protein
MIWHICSGVKVAGAPQRSASSSTFSTLSVRTFWLHCLRATGLSNNGLENTKLRIAQNQTRQNRLRHDHGRSVAQIEKRSKEQHIDNTPVTRSMVHNRRNKVAASTSQNPIAELGQGFEPG